MQAVEKQEAVETAVKHDAVARALEKLNRKAIDVEVPTNLSALETLQASLAELRAGGAGEEAVAHAEQQIQALNQDAIVASLISLKASDILLVQGWVTEVALKAREAGFELDVQLFLMAKAERCATIYLALRRRDNPNERYFQSQEAVTLADDRTLRELARIYAESFVLTEDERKNSLGAPRS